MVTDKKKNKLKAEQETAQPYMVAQFKKKRPRCGLNRAVKLTVTHTVQLRFCYCFYLYANVQTVKRDIVIAVIYCYITTDFYYAKRDSRLSAYGGGWY